MAHNPRVTSRTLRLALALAAFLGVAIVGMQLTGISLDGVIPTPTGDPPLPGAAREPFALVMAAALGAALVAYAAVEQRQTGELGSLSSQLTARALWLLPLAVVLDIALGAAAANGMALPLPMESTGTILVAMLCGPFAGALTGFMSLILWGMVIPAPYQLRGGARLRGRRGAHRPARGRRHRDRPVPTAPARAASARCWWRWSSSSPRSSRSSPMAGSCSRT